MEEREIYKGKTLQELKQMSINDFSKLLTSRMRRALKRGFTPAQKRLLEKIEKTKQGTRKKPIKTHIRDIPILPEMVGLTFQIYNGKEFIALIPTMEMLGHRIGEFAVTRTKTKHSAPGVGATRSSAGAKKKW